MLLLRVAYIVFYPMGSFVRRIKDDPHFCGQVRTYVIQAETVVDKDKRFTELKHFCLNVNSRAICGSDKLLSQLEPISRLGFMRNAFLTI